MAWQQLQCTLTCTQSSGLTRLIEFSLHTLLSPCAAPWPQNERYSQALADVHSWLHISTSGTGAAPDLGLSGACGSLAGPMSISMQPLQPMKDAIARMTSAPSGMIAALNAVASPAPSETSTPMAGQRSRPSKIWPSPRLLRVSLQRSDWGSAGHTVRCPWQTAHKSSSCVPVGSRHMLVISPAQNVTCNILRAQACHLPL